MKSLLMVGPFEGEDTKAAFVAGDLPGQERIVQRLVSNGYSIEGRYDAKADGFFPLQLGYLNDVARGLREMRVVQLVDSVGAKLEPSSLPDAIRKLQQRSSEALRAAQPVESTIFYATDVARPPRPPNVILPPADQPLVIPKPSKTFRSALEEDGLKIDALQRDIEYW